MSNTDEQKTLKEALKNFWFPQQGRVLRGFVQIQSLLEQAREQPGLDYLARWNKIGNAEEIARLIENEPTRILYGNMIERARADVDKKYSRTR